MTGLDSIFSVLTDPIYWVVSWCIPRYGMVEAHESAVKVTGPKVTQLEPGPYWYHRRLSTIYTVNVKRRTLEPSDLVGTTSDGVTVRVGLALAFEITAPVKWLIDNEDSEQGLLTEVQAVALEWVAVHEYSEILTELASDTLTKVAQKQLGRYFGVRVLRLRLTSFAETEARELNHSGISPSPLQDDEDE